MAIRVQIPSNLRLFTEQQSQVEMAGETVGQVLAALIDHFPELGPKLLGADQQLHSFIQIFIGDRSIRELDELETHLADGQTLLIVPALAGG